MLRTLTDENDDPWFVGKDVATILGYTNPRKALLDHVDDEDKTEEYYRTARNSPPPPCASPAKT
jgi:prophage antirepressor-like protein